MTETGLFDYVEPDFRASVTIAVAAEAVAVAALLAYLAVGRRPAAAPRGSTGARLRGSSAVRPACR